LSSKCHFWAFLASSVHFVSQFQSHTFNEAFLELFKYTPDVLHIYLYTKKDGTRAIPFQSPDFKAWFLWPHTHIGFSATWLKRSTFSKPTCMWLYCCVYFYTRTFALKSNYLHHHQLYTESQCKNLLFIYIHGTFRQKYSIKWNPSIFIDHFTPHIVYWRDRNQATSSMLNADTIL